MQQACFSVMGRYRHKYMSKKAWKLEVNACRLFRMPYAAAMPGKETPSLLLEACQVGGNVR